MLRLAHGNLSVGIGMANRPVTQALFFFAVVRTACGSRWVRFFQV